MGLNFKLIVTLSFLTLFSWNNCSPIERNSEPKTANTESVVTTETSDTMPTTSTTKPNMTSDEKTVPNTGQSTVTVAEVQMRFARHQTEKPNVGSDGKTPTIVHTIEEPEVSDQNIHEIIVRPEDQSKSAGNSDEPKDLNSSATSNGGLTTEEVSTESNDPIAPTNRD